MTDLSRRYLLILLLRSYNDLLPGLQKHGEDVGYVSRGKKSGAGKAPRHVGEDAQLWRQGSFKELGVALHKLADYDISAYHAVQVVWMSRKPAMRSQREYLREVLRFQVAGEKGLRFLEGHMPKTIQVPLELLENAGHVRRPS